MGSLATLIRERVAADDELARWQDEGRRRRLPLRPLPSVLSPAEFTAETLVRLGDIPPAPQWTWGVSNPWRVWIGQHVRRCVALVLTAVFDGLRTGQLQATGIVPGGDGSPVPVPAGTWSSASTVLDTRDNALSAGGVTLFVAVEVGPAAPQPRCSSRSALDRFVSTFDTALAAAGRRYVTAELVAAVGPAASVREVEAALRRASPVAWAGPGRRPACVVPTPAELAAAAGIARRAAETPA